MMDVKVWEEKIIIPTYKVGNPDKNPMFLEKRIYQGSSGVVYPHPIIDKVFDQKEDKAYTALYLENEYLKVMVLPELGGRIQMAYDKTNDYHFVYYNQVIKPALVGLTGPWISGGIEFNWPQHHRPSTFNPLDYRLQENPNGSKTISVSEIEIMFHTKGMASFTLYPDKAYIEVTGKLYNRTPFPQTFLWWANPAVHVDEHYQSIFPPDVHAVYDHGKRDVTSFPIATGTYYKVDYSPGTDISRYKNIPVPTSYMAARSEFDFVGGYHHKKKAGLLHVADHHVSPGKKQWTWGNGEFGQAWDRQLTDEDGPYFELMTGVFTDNQPDFGWIMPNEERIFKQYFMPFKEVGYLKNATKNALLNLEVADQVATMKVYVTSPMEVDIQLLAYGVKLISEKSFLSPTKTAELRVTLPAGVTAENLTAIIADKEGKEILTYQPIKIKDAATPEPAEPIGVPENIATIEELYLAGLHLEQYRHATYSPAAYYKEALRRNPLDIRNNNAMGLWYLRRGNFAEAELYLQKAVAKLVRHNPNPYDGEPLYNLGLVRIYQGQHATAYDLFYRACWNAAWQDVSYLQLARLEARAGSWYKALEMCDASLARNYHGFKARFLKISILRKLEKFTEAAILAQETLRLDSFDFGCWNELYLVQESLQDAAAASTLTELKPTMRDWQHSYLEVAIDYAHAGMFEEAIALLQPIAAKDQHPLTFYYLGYFYEHLGEIETAQVWFNKGFEFGPNAIFPNRLEDIQVLEKVIAANPADYKALYYLGNLWYDKRQYSEAIASWEKSSTQFSGFATVQRNLGIAYFNKTDKKAEALACFEQAFIIDRTDARVLFELDQLYKRLNKSIIERLDLLKENLALVNERDDLYIEYITLHNLVGEHQKALQLLAGRNFHPWEGGEGKVSEQYKLALIELAKHALATNYNEEAVAHLTKAGIYPHNLGEGKLYGAQENDMHYWLGCAHDQLGKQAEAQTYWKKAAGGLSEPAPAIFYNDPNPDTIFYQGLALEKLGERESALTRYHKLFEYAELHLTDEIKIDFFAVSLPDLMIFDDDLNKRNYIHCLYLMGLSKLGLKEFVEAEKYLHKVITLNTCHQGALTHLHFLKKELSMLQPVDYLHKTG